MKKLIKQTKRPKINKTVKNLPKEIRDLIIDSNQIPKKGKSMTQILNDLRYDC